MGFFICVILLVCLLIISKFIFRINIKKAREIEENEEIEIITNKFPDNKEIAKEMLAMMNNTNVAIEEARNTKTSLYIALTNKIIIADIKGNYGRIQTIAHEVLHSCQDRRLLISNVIISNILLLYYIITIILTICGVYTNLLLQLVILSILSFASFVIRSFLEIDAMTKSRFLAEKYIKSKKLCRDDETVKILKSYDEINQLGIPFTVDNLFNTAIIKILIYTVICIFI